MADTLDHPGRPSAAQGVVLAIGAVATVVMAATTLGSTAGEPDVFAALSLIAMAATAVSLVLSGAVLVRRLPSHPVGWLLWASGFLFSIAGSAQGLAFGGGVDPRLAGWVAVIGGAAWVPAIVGVIVLLPLVFPTGRLPSRRWRIVVAVAIAAVVCNIVQSALAPFDSSSTPTGIVNPLAVTGFALDVANLLGALSSISGVICLPLVAASLVLRYRNATGIERAQLKWLAAGVAISGPAFALGILLQRVPGELGSLLSDLAYLIAFVGMAMLPVAIGIAILRYRLYDIDVIIRRTAVYVPLTAILAGLYAGSTALLQRLFVLATGQPSDGAVIATTLILATLFTPIKAWLQGLVDQRFRDDVDAERQLERYLGHLAEAEWTLDPTRTLRVFLRVLVRATEAAGGRALRDGASPESVAGLVGTPDPVALTVPIAWETTAVGRVELGPHRGTRDYREREVELVRAAGRRLGAIIATGVDPGRAARPLPPEATSPSHTPELDATPGYRAEQPGG